MTAQTCTRRIVIPTFNAEFVPEEDGGRCTALAVARLVTEHDGEKCGDGGLCLLDPEEGLELDPWKQTELLCVDHLFEHERAVAERGPLVGETLTRL
ncbi:hypothetical protein GA0070610_1787 [Micromonospora echinofusca]|uniref:Uncharacterized protein n=1 Tax=Micromonospora echinofusca TaxID=47858 RepID=A0A1C5G6J4_MICEH|nr:hypothetical protein [Micromonospora echinofusca]SCG15553.1 hypothetical protein GA0070610_1787 [Micromonospora echinofusca]